MMPLRLLVPGLLATALAAAEAPAAPTAAVWKPVAEALAAHHDRAEPLLVGITQQYPGWIDGWRELARTRLAGGRAEGALTAVRKALAIDGKDPVSLALEIRALGALGKTGAVWERIANGAGLDPKGNLRYEAGLVAIGVRDAARAASYLAEAKLRCGPQVPVEFLVLEARIAIQQGQLEQAEVVLASAVAQKPAFWDGWYELGRVRLARAELEPAAADEHRKGADEAFGKAARGDLTDADARLALGRTRLEMARALALAGEQDRAGSRLRDSLQPLEECLALVPDQVAALSLYGEALVRLSRHADAEKALSKARSLGAQDRGLLFNLATALNGLGQVAEADALLSTVTVESPAEQLAVGMNSYDGGNDRLAYRLLTAAAPQLPGEALQAGAWRYAGHAAARLAEQGKDQADSWLDQAAAAYRSAGDLGDAPARRAYVALQAPRSSDMAYEAGWALISWNGFASMPGWSLVLGHYGAAKSGGAGLAGVAARAPLHLAIWGLLAGVPLGVGLWLALRRRPGGRQPEQKPASGIRPAVSAPMAPAPRPGLRTRAGDSTSTRTGGAPMTPTVRPRRGMSPETPTPPHGRALSADTMLPSPFAAGGDDALEKRGG